MIILEFVKGNIFWILVWVFIAVVVFGLIFKKYNIAKWCYVGAIVMLLIAIATPQNADHLEMYADIMLNGEHIEFKVHKVDYMRNRIILWDAEGNKYQTGYENVILTTYENGEKKEKRYGQGSENK